MSRWIRPTDRGTSQGRIDRPFDDAEFADGLTIEAAFRVADASVWDDAHVWSILRREAPPRVLLAIQDSGNIGLNGITVGETGKPGLSFGLVTGEYQELDVSLDGRDGRPTFNDLFDGKIHHIAAVYDRVTGVKALYFDGHLIAESDTADLGGLSIKRPGVAAEIGVFSGGELFGGELLGVVVYDEPLDETKIEFNYKRWIDQDAPRPSGNIENEPAAGE